MVYFKDSNFSRFQRGSNIFQWRWVQLFTRGEGGSQMLISIETYRTCDFPGESGPPAPPLWIRACDEKVRQKIKDRSYEIHTISKAFCF